MPDLLRIVRYDEQDQLVVLSDLENALVHKLRNTFTVTPGARNAVMAGAETRRGGAGQVAELIDDGRVGATFAVNAASTDDAIDALERILAQADDGRPGRYLAFKPEAGSDTTLYRLEGTGTAAPAWEARKAAAGYLTVEASWPIHPLAEELRLDFSDDFRYRGLDDTAGIASKARPVNEVVSPQGYGTPTGWVVAAGSGTSLTPTNDAAVGGAAAGGAVTWAGVAITTTAPVIDIGRKDGTTAASGFFVTAGERIGMRLRFRLDAGAPTTLQLQVDRFAPDGVTAVGASGLTTSTTPGDTAAAGVNNPPIGTIYELAGYFDVPAGTDRVMIRPRLGFAASGVNFSATASRAAFYRMPAGATAVPAYIDGDGPSYRWESTPYLSRSIPTLETGLEGYVFSGGGGALPPFHTGYMKITQAANGSGSNGRVAYLARRPFQDGWVTVKGRIDPSSPLSDHAVPPGIRYSPVDGKYFWAGLTGSGSLRVYQTDGANNQTVRASVAQAVPAAGVSFWNRIRAEGRVITVEHWLSQPTPTGTPTNSISYTIPADDPEGMVRPGYALLNAYTSTTSVKVLEGWEVRPYTYKNVAAPASITLPPVPGTAPAALDLELSTATADTDYPRALIVGWRRAKVGPFNAQFPNGLVVQAEDRVESGGAGGFTAPDIDAAMYRGPGTAAGHFTLTNADASAWADFRIDPGMFEADEFDDACTVAVIARYRRSSASMVSPRLRAELRTGATGDGDFLGLAPEYGATGRYLPAGLGMRTTVLGTLRVPVDQPEPVDLRITAAWSLGTSAGTAIYIDELVLLPTQNMAATALGKQRDDGSYSPLVPGNGYTRRIRSDLRGALANWVNIAFGPPRPRAAALNIGGAPLELPSALAAPEGVEYHVRPMVQVPDDPVAAGADILNHTTTVHFAVTPRRYAFA